MRTVSVIIPAYNAEGFIARAVESALSQTYPVAEIIVVDDGSTDCTCEIVRSFGEPVRLLKLPHQGNASVARNRGIERAAGEYVAFLDADDIWLPEKTAVQLKMMRDDEALVLACTNAFRQTDPHDSEDMGSLLNIPAQRTDPDHLDVLVLDNYVVTSSVLVRRTAIEERGLFSESSDLLLVADYDLWIRLAAEAPIAYAPEPLLVYRDWGSSYRDEWSAARVAESVLLIMNRLEQLYPLVARRHRRALRERRAHLSYELVIAARRAGDRRFATRTALRFIVQAPGHLTSWKMLARSLLG